LDEFILLTPQFLFRYLELKYTIDMNFADNAFSVYTTCCWPYEPALPFQIDANYGFTAAVLAMLVTDLPVPTASKATHTVLLGPAIPSAWAGGSVENLRLRGGGMVDFSWDDNGLVTTATLHDSSSRSEAISIVNKAGKVLAYKH
jgi:alpha-L-fucosidase 2